MKLKNVFVILLVIALTVVSCQFEPTPTKAKDLTAKQAMAMSAFVSSLEQFCMSAESSGPGFTKTVNADETKYTVTFDEYDADGIEFNGKCTLEIVGFSDGSATLMTIFSVELEGLDLTALDDSWTDDDATLKLVVADTMIPSSISQISFSSECGCTWSYRFETYVEEFKINNINQSVTKLQNNIVPFCVNSCSCCA